MNRRAQSPQPHADLFDIWNVEVIRRNQPVTFEDGSTDDIWDAVLHVWAMGRGLMVFELPNELIEDWPNRTPATAIDAVAEAIREANRNVRSSVMTSIVLKGVKSIDENAERSMARRGADVDFVERVHRSVEAKLADGCFVNYFKATLAYEPNFDDGDAEEGDE